MWPYSQEMHSDEQWWGDALIRTNLVNTVGPNINEIEKQAAEQVDGILKPKAARIL